MEAAKMKFHYFELYARGEPIRMAMWKGKVPYENCRYTGDKWKEFKANKAKCAFGQVPVLELADGTCLTQTMTILHYIGDITGQKPKDPLLNAKGDEMAQRVNLDVMPKFPGALFSKDDD